MRAAETPLKRSRAEARQDEAVVRKKLAAVEHELAIVRAERESRARELPKSLLADYEKILRARGGVAVAAVTTSAISGRRRDAIGPPAVQQRKAPAGIIVREGL